MSENPSSSGAATSGVGGSTTVTASTCAAAEGPTWWTPTQPWKSPGARNPEAGKNVSVTTINVPPSNNMHDGKSVCKYLGENGVTVSVVSNVGPDLNCLSQESSLNSLSGQHITSQSQQQQDDLEDSDGEVSRIDFRGVNLRTKKKRDPIHEIAQPNCDENGETPHQGETIHQQPERPMSWEGELSDQEMSSNTITNTDVEDTSMEGVCSISPKPQDQKFPIKSEPDFRSSPPLNETVVPVPHSSQQHNQQTNPEQNQQNDLPLLVGKLLGGCNSSTPNHSPVLVPRHHLTKQHHTRSQVPSPDSAIHSGYSVFSSPTQSPHAARHSALDPASPAPSSSHSLSRSSFNNSNSSLSLSHSLSRNNSDASSVSCYSYGSISPPNHSPIQQPRYPHHQHHQLSQGSPLHLQQGHPGYAGSEIGDPANLDDQDDCRLPSAPAGISTRQQLINSPCPICGDKISGFHYGIFSCESCKGFFKRTVQNRKNYVCLRGAGCPVTVATRKKCPACRFDKCLNMGMKLEAIREDRTRGGRSTYQCTYTLPPNIIGSPASLSGDKISSGPCSPAPSGSEHSHSMKHHHSQKSQAVPQLLQDIMDVEHLWHNDNSRFGSRGHHSFGSSVDLNEDSLSSLTSTNGLPGGKGNSTEGQTESVDSKTSGTQDEISNDQSDASANPLHFCYGKNPTQQPDFLSNLCNIADHRLYKIVKWCKSLPLFKNISIDDQICLLINSWCELLLFSCCFRSMSTPGEIRVSLGKSITLEQAKQLGLATCIERMLAFTNNLRRLRVDQYEYVAMKVIVLLTSDTSELKEPEKVRASQEKALQALQQYTVTKYPEMPAKFGELLLRIPDLQRTCQAGKELLSAKRAEGDGSSFNLLMELLRGDH